MKTVRDRRLLKTVISGGILAITSLLTLESLANSSAKPGCVIKGNISVSKNRKLYHLPGMRNYEATIIDPTKGERWFCSEAEAQANGWVKAPR